MPILWKLTQDHGEAVVFAAFIAIGHNDFHGLESRCADFLVHPSAEVRYAVTWALASEKSEIATGMLMQLSGDADPEVRSWATFGLGSQRDTDTPALREALFRRLDDEHDETRVGRLYVEAAGELGDPELLESLVALEGWWDLGTRLLQEAVEACRGAM